VVPVDVASGGWGSYSMASCTSGRCRRSSSVQRGEGPCRSPTTHLRRNVLAVLAPPLPDVFSRPAAPASRHTPSGSWRGVPPTGPPTPAGARQYRPRSPTRPTAPPPARSRGWPRAKAPIVGAPPPGTSTAKGLGTSSNTPSGVRRIGVSDGTLSIRSPTTVVRKLGSISGRADMTCKGPMRSRGVNPGYSTKATVFCACA
jgi:hypothetical protein